MSVNVALAALTKLIMLTFMEFSVPNSQLTCHQQLNSLHQKSRTEAFILIVEKLLISF